MIRILINDFAYAPIAAWVRPSLLFKIRGWQKRGAKITLICSTEAKRFYQKELPGVIFFTFPFTFRSKTRWTVPLEYFWANVLAFPYIFKVIGRFDIIYSHTSTLDIIFFPWVLKFFDHKVRWFTMMDNLVPKPNERPGDYVLKTVAYLAFLTANVLLKRVDGMFVVTNLLKRYYQKKGINVIKTGTGNGLDIESFTKKISPGVPSFSCLFGGRLNPVKGIFDLVEIIKKIVEKEKNFTLGMMGEGENHIREELEKKIIKNNLSQNIFLLGHKNAKERWDLYRRAGFFLFPSYAEGCPRVVLEAFAANRLVVGYNLSEYRDAFEKYIKTGQLILFKKGDTKAMAKHILSIRGKKFSFYNKLSDYSWNKIVENEWKAFVKQ